MRSLTIAVNCDDVLLPSTEYIVNIYNKMFGTSVRVDGAHLPGNNDWGADREVVHQRIDGIQRSREYGLVKPFEAAIEVVRRLATSHELHLVTARQPSVVVVTQQMLDIYFTDFFVAIEHVGMEGTKGDICARIGADVLIDDNVKHLQNAYEHGMSHDGLLWFGDYPWQAEQAQIAGRPPVRCKSWGDIERVINQLARGGDADE